MEGRRGSLSFRSLSVDSLLWTASKIVNDIANAIGPLNQFRVTPLKKPTIPCSAYNSLTMAAIDGGLEGVTARMAASAASALVDPLPTQSTAASTPEVGTIPMVCIRRRVTSKGYAIVCAINPDSPPHTIRSTVVTSRPVIFCIYVERFRM